MAYRPMISGEYYSFRGQTMNEVVRDTSGRNDVEYHIGKGIFHDIESALTFAGLRALNSGKATIDVIVYSEDGARYINGADGVEQYNEDPDASVFRRLTITINDEGRVP